MVRGLETSEEHIYKQPTVTLNKVTRNGIEQLRTAWLSHASSSSPRSTHRAVCRVEGTCRCGSGNPPSARGSSPLWNKGLLRRSVLSSSSCGTAGQQPEHVPLTSSG